MNKYFLICAILMVSSIILAQVPEWQWAVRAGGIQEDNCNCIATDNQGNVYIAGTFRETANFGSTVLTSTGDQDIFIAKLDMNGNWLWAVKAGGIEYDEIYGIATDNTGYVYVTGCFYYTATFGTYTLTSSGSTDIYVAKLDTNGNFTWAVRGGGFSSDQSYSIAVNTTGVVITGYVSGDVAFGSHPLSGFGQQDIFIAKLDANGNWLWARNAGGLYYDVGISVALDDMGYIYATGCFEDDANFAGTILSSLGEEDIFIAKLSPDGFLLAAFRAGGISEDTGTGITLDTSGNVYLTGYFMLSIGFGPTVMTSFGNADIFLTKMSSGAIYQWARQAGGLSDDVGISITVDNQGNSYVTGYFMDAASFADVTLTSYGLQDVYIAKLDTNGFLNWVVKAGGVSWDQARGIAFAGSGDIYCAGVFETAAVFGNTILTSQGNQDIFVTKLYSSNVGNDDVGLSSVTSHPILYNAFPNPFNPSTTISFDLPSPGLVNLDIYNVKGQKVKSLANEHFTQGDHSVSWNGTDDNDQVVASGVYFARMNCKGQETSRKLVLLK
jgi:hypothetical protein